MSTSWTWLEIPAHVPIRESVVAPSQSYAGLIMNWLIYIVEDMLLKLYGTHPVCPIYSSPFNPRIFGLSHVRPIILRPYRTHLIYPIQAHFWSRWSPCGHGSCLALGVNAQNGWVGLSVWTSGWNETGSKCLKTEAISFRASDIWPAACRGAVQKRFGFKGINVMIQMIMT